VDSPRGLVLARVALTMQVSLSPEKLEALLGAADRSLGERLALLVDQWVREHETGYYPALEFLASQGAVPPDLYESLRHLAATLRKRVKRDVQTRLWPVFSSVHIERAQSLAFQLPHPRPGRPHAIADLARHYFPNVVRLDLVLSSLDKPHHLEDVVRMSEQKALRNLLDHFETISVTTARRLEP